MRAFLDFKKKNDFFQKFNIPKTSEASEETKRLQLLIMFNHY